MSWLGKPDGARTAIAVVVPCRNGARYVSQALESVDQQEPALCLDRVFVDDGSTDDSASIARQAGWRVVSTGGDARAGRGVSHARNVGLALTSAPLVAFLDADDWWLPGHLTSLCALLWQWPQCTFAFAAMRVEPNGGAMRMAGPPLPEGRPTELCHRLLASNIASPSAVVARRDALRRVGGFPVGLHYGEDLLTLWRLSLEGPGIFSGRTTACYRRHGEQTSANIMRSYAGALDMRRAQATDLKQLPERDRARLLPAAARGWEEIAGWYWASGRSDLAADVLRELRETLGVAPSPRARLRSGRVGYWQHRLRRLLRRS